MSQFSFHKILHYTFYILKWVNCPKQTIEQSQFSFHKILLYYVLYFKVGEHVSILKIKLNNILYQMLFLTYCFRRTCHNLQNPLSDRMAHAIVAITDLALFPKSEHVEKCPKQTTEHSQFSIHKTPHTSNILILKGQSVFL